MSQFGMYSDPKDRAKPIKLHVGHKLKIEYEDGSYVTLVYSGKLDYGANAMFSVYDNRGLLYSFFLPDSGFDFILGGRKFKGKSATDTEVELVMSKYDGEGEKVAEGVTMF